MVLRALLSSQLFFGVCAWQLGIAHEAKAAVRSAVAPVLSATVETVATRVRCSHILVESEDLANVVMDQLNSGVAFAALAESVSMCESAANGGDLGWISAGMMVPGFEEVAFRTLPGESRLVQSAFGWHVLRVAEASTVPFAIPPLELRARLLLPDSDGLVIVDARDHEELERAVIPGITALHLPYSEWVEWAPRVISGELQQLTPEKEVVFVCHRGGRAERLAQYLAQQGFAQTRYLEGGINGYAEQADASVPVYLESDGDCNTCHEH